MNIRVLAEVPPSPISDPHAYGFKIVQHTVQQLFKNTVVGMTTREEERRREVREGEGK